MRAEGVRRAAMAAAIALAVGSGGGIPALAQPAPIAPLPRFDGTWYEVAVLRDSGGSAAARPARCSTGGPLGDRGRRCAAGVGRRRVSRCAPAGCGPRATMAGGGLVSRRRCSAGCRASWGDFWVLGHDPELSWFVVGEHDHRTPVGGLAHGRARRGGARPRAGAGAPCRFRRRTAGAGDPRRRRLAQTKAGPRALVASQRRSRLRRSSSSRVRGQSPFSSRDNPRSASSRPSVWQVGQ